MRKKFTLISLVALLLVAVVPTTVLAATKTFTASGVIERTEVGTASLNLSTLLLETTGQVFEGGLSSSDWRPLRGAEIRVYQDSFIGADIFDLVLSGNGTTPLLGFAQGSFDLKRGRSELSGSYVASIGGALTLDPTCAPTDAFASVGIPLLQVRVDVVDAGGWTVVPGSSQGAYNAVSELGGTLAALASGCIGGQEVASISITGTLGHDDDDRDGDRDDDRNRGDDDDDEEDGDDDDDDDDNHDDNKRGKGGRGR